MNDETDAATSFTLNGRTVSVGLPEATPLLYALRGPLGARTARFGCGDGLCGACTVIVDGKAVMSCDMPLSEAAGTRVETAESLAEGATPHPLFEAVLEFQAAQCGYCVPGILMAAKALLDANPDPSRDEIIEAIDANLCRCGAHTRLIAAIESAAKARVPA